MITSRWQHRFNKNDFEKKAWQEGKFVCGIDEVGRGCLAGPVVAAAVILKKKTHPSIKDSKIMTSQEREAALVWIKKNSWYGLAIMHNRLIDSHNIYQSTLLAMKRAFMQLMSVSPANPSIVLTDAMPLTLSSPPFNLIDVLYFPFGEKKSTSIAAASIIAKVVRDKLMERMHRAMPGYLLDQHKGYGTPAHKQMVRTRGASIIHRLNFLQTITIETSEQETMNNQLSLLPGDHEEHSSLC